MGLFFAAFAAPGWSQSLSVLQPEFVSLEQPANFENGALVFGQEHYVIDAMSETSDDVYVYKAGLQNADGSALFFSSPEAEGIEIVFVRQGVNYRGSGFTRVSRQSNLIADHEVLEFHGVLVSEQGQEVPASLTVTESMSGGGDSEISIEGEYAILRGNLGTRTYNQIFALIRQHPQVRTIVEQNVPGSVNDEINMQTGRLIRRAGLATHIPAGGEAHSGGVDLFCAGARRSLSEGAKLGVHSWSGDDTEARFIPADSPEHAAQIAYFTEMLGHPTGREFYFFTINAAAADDIHLMSPQEIAQFQLQTQ